MESQRRTGSNSGSSRKQPLSDITNDVHLHSSSSLLKKPVKPFPVSSEHIDSRKRPKLHLDKAQSTTGSTTGAVTQSTVSIPTSAALQVGSSISTPARSLPKPSSAAVGGDDVREPSTVYVRRQSVSKRKDKEKVTDTPATMGLSGRDKFDKGGGIDLSKSLMVPSGKVGSSISTPARSLPKPSSAASGGDDVHEPSTVYVRRQSVSKRKDKEKVTDAPGTVSHSSRDKMDIVDRINLSKSLMVPSQKKTGKAKMVSDDVEHTLPKDFIEEQKQYFADIDAFELLEEEVTSADELE